MELSQMEDRSMESNPVSPLNGRWVHAWATAFYFVCVLVELWNWKWNQNLNPRIPVWKTRIPSKILNHFTKFLPPKYCLNSNKVSRNTCSKTYWWNHEANKIHLKGVKQMERHTTFRDDAIFINILILPKLIHSFNASPTKGTLKLM